MPALGYRRFSANGCSREDGDRRFQLCHQLLKRDGVEDDSFNGTAISKVTMRGVTATNRNQSDNL